MKLKKFFAAAIVLLTAGQAMAQMMPPIPVDKDVRIGHLDNGLTYYIRHNSFPEHVASFYIAQKVGSINENDDQRGLAHLLEHLAFNGSEHFQGNSLQEYLQSIGVEYGRNLNAYTSIEKTVYYFTDVPTTRVSAVDSCMLILKDWSNGISLTKEAINDYMKSVADQSYGYNEDMIVSSDIIGMRFGSLFDSTQTMVQKIDEDTYQVQVVAWYDI